MKLIDNLRAVTGDDKLLHFLVAALVTSFGLVFNMTVGILAFCLVLALSVVKELLWDDFFNWKDLVAGVLGGIATLLFYFFLVM